jgi:hypothetical protein
VASQFRGNDIVVSGETTGVKVVIKTPVERVIVDVDDGEFEEALGVEPGENQIIVAAADKADLEAAGTTVWRMSL